MYEFPKGDKVRIRWDIATIKREPPGINAEMCEMGGKVCTVSKARSDRCMLEEVPYIWLYKWLELYVEEPEDDIAVQDLNGIL